MLLKSVVRFCGPKAGAWLLPGPTLIRSSTLPEFHSLLGLFLFLKALSAKWLLVCLRQESSSSATVGRVHSIAFPFCVQLSTVFMPSWCPNPLSPRLPRRVPCTSFQSSLSPQSSRHHKTSLNKLDKCTLEGESSTSTFPRKTSNHLKHKPTLLSVYHVHFFPSSIL